jgi:amidase
MKIFRATLAAAIAAAIAIAQLDAVTRVPSADGQFWDIQDTSPWAQDSGGIATGGRANPFNGFGYLKLQVRRADNVAARRNQYLRGFGLHHDGAGRFDSTTPVLTEGILVARDVTTSKDTQYLRYFDTFTNSSTEERIVQVAFGGAAGAYEDGGQVAIAATSNGDRRIDLTDAFVTVMQNANKTANPGLGPSGHGPSAHVIGSKPGLLTSIGDMYGDPFVDAYPGFDPAHLAYVFTIRLRPAETRALVTFVVKGLSEVYDPRGGYPIPLKDALTTGEAVYSGPDARIPAAGSEIKRVTDIAAELAKTPDLRGLSPLQRSQIANWSLPVESGFSRTTAQFTVFEKTVPELQARWRMASSRPRTSPGSISRGCHSTIAMVRPSDPCLRSIRVRSPTLARAMPNVRPGAHAVRFTASRLSSRTTSIPPNCRPPADRWRSSIIVRASIRASLPE